MPMNALEIEMRLTNVAGTPVNALSESHHPPGSFCLTGVGNIAKPLVITLAQIYKNIKIRIILMPVRKSAKSNLRGSLLQRNPSPGHVSLTPSIKEDIHHLRSGV